MLPSLPANDPVPAERAARLEDARRAYRYAFDEPPGVAMAAEVPKGEGYSPAVVAKVAALAVAMKVNRAASHSPFTKEASKPSTLASCRALFATIGAPPVASIAPDDARADAAFAWQRVAGANPFALEAVEQLPDGFPVTPADFAAASEGVCEGDSLDRARQEGRLYVASYGLLDGVPAGVGGGAQKYLEAPIALFVHVAGRGLAPVAIQCAQQPAADAPILTPRDGVAWQMARAVVQVADCNVHELFFHLGRAHFLVEAFALAAARQLSARHPLAVLLAPHFEGTLAINDGARTKLCAPGGQLEELLGPTREAALALSRRAIKTFRLEDAIFPADLRRRGVGDAARLADYPYRDDGQLLWSATSAFVRDYLALYYEGDAGVATDPELAAFVREVRSDVHGRVRGFPERIETRAALSDAVAWLVFTASAQHAALNYPQLDFMAYAPNMPAAGYAPRPTKALANDADAAWSRMLPPAPLAADQLDFFYQQSNVRHDRLGHYPHGHFADPRVAPLVARFSAALDDAETTIAERDRARLLPYPYLLPSNVTASIHI